MSKKAIINNVRYQHKHETQENWEKAYNFVPLKAEIIIYDPDELHSEPRIKIGDGIYNPETKKVEGTNVNDLPFYGEKKELVWGDFTNNTINSSAIAWGNF